MRPRLLDLFCGAGGAAMGYHRAGFDVVGVDIKPQPNYPFEFVQADALRWMETRLARSEHWGAWLFGFDAVHASPPCQAYSVLRHAAADKGSVHLDLVDETRELLERSGLPWVMENVPGAPLSPYSLLLCGSMFGLGVECGRGEDRAYRQLRRHRLFETTFSMMQPHCVHRGQAIGVYGGGPVGRYTFGNGAQNDRYNRRGGWQGDQESSKIAMGIDWMIRRELTQAIPPAYTEHIGGYLLAEIRARQEQAA